VAAAPSLALVPRRRSLLGFGRILIYRNVGGPIAVESTYRVDAQKLAVLLIDCDRHALRQEGAISLRNLGRSELFQSRTVILRYEFENPFGIRLGLTADDRSGDARGLRHRRQRQRQNCNKSGLVHSSRPPSLSSLAFDLPATRAQARFPWSSLNEPGGPMARGRVVFIRLRYPEGVDGLFSKQVALFVSQAEFSPSERVSVFGRRRRCRRGSGWNLKVT
jgi:hypothetical protein